jgi:hypothetical protein
LIKRCDWLLPWLAELSNTYYKILNSSHTTSTYSSINACRMILNVNWLIWAVTMEGMLSSYRIRFVGNCIVKSTPNMTLSYWSKLSKCKLFLFVLLCCRTSPLSNLHLEIQIQCQGCWIWSQISNNTFRNTWWRRKQNHPAILFY